MRCGFRALGSPVSPDLIGRIARLIFSPEKSKNRKSKQIPIENVLVFMDFHGFSLFSIFAKKKLVVRSRSVRWVPAVSEFE